MRSPDDFRVRRETLCSNALNWVKTNINEFDPSAHKVNQNLRLKALSELLFTCSLHNRRFGTLRSPLDEFVAQGVGAIRKMNYIDNIHRKPELVLPYSMIYKSVRDCGTKLGALKDAVQSMLDIGLPMATEDNPYRKMELRYALQGGGFRRLPPPIRTLFRETSLCTSLRDTPPVLSFRLDHIYGLTHVVFYLTDFGLSAVGKIPEAASLRWLVSAMLGMQTLDRNWDAVAELLLCCDSLGHYPSPLYWQAWSRLFEAQKSDGSLTDNFFDAKKFESMSAPEKSRYYFEQHYHTTLVCAAAAFLSDGRSVEEEDAVLTSRGGRSRRNCSRQVAKAGDWMLRTYEEQSGELDLSSLLYILAGQWGAAAVVSDRPPHHERSRGFYVRILDDMLTAIRSSPHSVDACDPALVLLGEGILRRFGLRVPHFELLARNSANALLGYESPVDHGLNLFPVTHLLESLGFELKARTGDRETDEAMIKNDEGKPPEELSHTLANYVSKVTSFGSRGFRASEPGLVDTIRGNLVALAFHFLHQYKLEEGFLLARAMNHAGMNGSKPFEEAIDFVLAQQKGDGSFGFYADETQLIARSDSGFDPLRRMTLPITVSAIWTIAEATERDFSLFNSIRAPRYLPR